MKIILLTALAIGITSCAPMRPCLETKTVWVPQNTISKSQVVTQYRQHTVCKQYCNETSQEPICLEYNKKLKEYEESK
jgi:hypothetical protein